MVPAGFARYARVPAHFDRSGVDVARAVTPQGRLWAKVKRKGLDKGSSPFKINFINSVVMPTACDHTRTEIIARRDGVDYLECLDCRQIFEAEDLEPVKVEDDEESG